MIGIKEAMVAVAATETRGKTIKMGENKNNIKG